MKILFPNFSRYRSNIIRALRQVSVKPATNRASRGIEFVLWRSLEGTIEAIVPLETP